jgi:hypothetical protein
MYCSGNDFWHLELIGSSDACIESRSSAGVSAVVDDSPGHGQPDAGRQHEPEEELLVRVGLEQVRLRDEEEPGFNAMITILQMLNNLRKKAIFRKINFALFFFEIVIFL